MGSFCCSCSIAVVRLVFELVFAFYIGVGLVVACLVDVACCNIVVVGPVFGLVFVCSTGAGPVVACLVDVVVAAVVS